MRGHTLILWAGGLLVIFTGALWYTQFYAFYDDLAEQPLTIQGTTYPVEEWQGIDATSSPLKRRVCLRVSAETARQIGLEQTALSDGEPLVAPSWFDCFDARQIAQDLAAGRAQLYSPGPSGFDGVDDYLAIYPDGRGYLWRLLQAEYRDK